MKNKKTLITYKNGKISSKQIWEETLYNHLSSSLSKLTIDECWLLQYFNQSLRPYDRFDISFSFSGLTDFHLKFLIGEKQIKVFIDDEIKHHHEIIHKEAVILIRESINSIKKLLPIYYPENCIRYVTGMIPFTYDSLTEELLQKENKQ